MRASLLFRQGGRLCNCQGVACHFKSRRDPANETRQGLADYWKNGVQSRFASWSAPPLPDLYPHFLGGLRQANGLRHTSLGQRPGYARAIHLSPVGAKQGVLCCGSLLFRPYRTQTASLNPPRALPRADMLRAFSLRGTQKRASGNVGKDQAPAALSMGLQLTDPGSSPSPPWLSSAGESAAHTPRTPRRWRAFESQWPEASPQHHRSRNQLAIC
jgi:hypothetical protein